VIVHRAKWDLSAFTSRHGYVRLGAREEFYKDSGSVNVHAHCDWTCYLTSEPTQVLTASLVFHVTSSREIFEAVFSLRFVGEDGIIVCFFKAIHSLGTRHLVTGRKYVTYRCLFLGSVLTSM
jgi:hypothetical protein